MKYTVSYHYREDRQDRENLIRKIGYGKKIDEFIVDRGHPAGPERHEISDTGIVTIFNARTGKMVTKLIANPNQVRRYYEAQNRIAPEFLLRIAYDHMMKNYNNM